MSKRLPYRRCRSFPSEIDIYQMYLTEGLPEVEAKQKAQVIHKELDVLSKKESRLWRKVRAHEVSSGLKPTREEV